MSFQQVHIKRGQGFGVKDKSDFKVGKSAISFNERYMNKMGDTWASFYIDKESGQVGFRVHDTKYPDAVKIYRSSKSSTRGQVNSPTLLREIKPYLPIGRYDAMRDEIRGMYVLVPLVAEQDSVVVHDMAHSSYSPAPELDSAI